MRREQVREWHRHTAGGPVSAVWAAARRSPNDRAVQRSGWGIAVIQPKSGHVRRRRRCLSDKPSYRADLRRRADGPMPLSVVTSLAPIMIRAASGREPVTKLASTWLASPLTWLRQSPWWTSEPGPVELGQAAGDERPWYLVGQGAAVPGGGGIAEHHQMQADVQAAFPAVRRSAAGGRHRPRGEGRPKTWE